MEIIQSISLGNGGNGLLERKMLRKGITIPDYGYTGQMKEGDIYFYNSRWYDPAIGRFMQADTIVPMASQGTQAFDRYAYVNNNPLRYTDPGGNRACDDYYGRGCNVLQDPLLWYQTDGVYHFTGSGYIGIPISGPVSPSQDSNISDPYLVSTHPIHQIGLGLDVLGSQLGMHIPVIEHDDRDNIFWNLRLTVNDGEISLTSFQIQNEIIGYKIYMFVSLDAIAYPDLFVRKINLIENVNPDELPNHTYYLDFMNLYQLGKPNSINLNLRILCGSCNHNSVQIKFFSQKIK